MITAFKMVAIHISRTRSSLALRTYTNVYILGRIEWIKKKCVWNPNVLVNRLECFFYYLLSSFCARCLCLCLSNILYVRYYIFVWVLSFFYRHRRCSTEVNEIGFMLIVVFSHSYLISNSFSSLVVLFWLSFVTSLVHTICIFPIFNIFIFMYW